MAYITSLISGILSVILGFCLPTMDHWQYWVGMGCFVAAIIINTIQGGRDV